MSGADSSRYAVPTGRALFATIFLLSGIGNFTPQAIEYASAQGVPMASWLVPLSAVLAVLGGLSVAIGYKTRIGALLLILFLIPVTLTMHCFWMESEPQMRMMEQM